LGKSQQEIKTKTPIGTIGVLGASREINRFSLDKQCAASLYQNKRYPAPSIGRVFETTVK
jgi:hypothetical protein